VKSGQREIMMATAGDHEGGVGTAPPVTRRQAVAPPPRLFPVARAAISKIGSVAMTAAGAGQS